MITIHSIKAAVIDSQKKEFGFFYEFTAGLNILSGDNSSGKSTVLSCIYYCLAMEQLASYGNNDGLKECLKNSFQYDNQKHFVASSYAELHLSNDAGETAIIKRLIKPAYNEDTNLLLVQQNDGEPEEKFVHKTGDTDHPDGFYRWLSEFSNIAVPVFKDEDGKFQKILYLQQIFASSFVEQTKGWSDFFAQIPVFSTKKAKQKIVEYTLGLSGLAEEFELEVLKQHEKQYRAVWTNTIDSFQTITSYYNFQTPNLSDTFTSDLSPAKIAKLDLKTKDEHGKYNSISETITKLDRIKTIRSINNSVQYINAPYPILEKHAELRKKITILGEELNDIIVKKNNENLKVKNYQLTIEHLNREIEALEGINKITELKSFKIRDVENCPVCNSSLLSNPDIELANVDKVNSSKSLPFFKAEKSLYESYIKSSENLSKRINKTILYYQEKINDIKNALTMLDEELTENSKIPSRMEIAEEMRIAFELQKMQKLSKQFELFKSDLSTISEKLAGIRADISILKDNIKIDHAQILKFTKEYVSNLNKFGYSQEILDRIFISTEENTKMFPVVKTGSLSPQPIRLVSSASDFIRAQWAFYMTLLVQAKHHLGILIIDEPGQHAIADADLQQLLKEASKIKDRQIIIAISKEDKIRTTGDNEKPEVEIDLLKILEESKLEKDEDYKINIIDSHNRKDKCIQPLP